MKCTKCIKCTKMDKAYKVYKVSRVCKMYKVYKVFLTTPTPQTSYQTLVGLIGIIVISMCAHWWRGTCSLVCSSVRVGHAWNALGSSTATSAWKLWWITLSTGSIPCQWLGCLAAELWKPLAATCIPRTDTLICAIPILQDGSFHVRDPITPPNPSLPLLLAYTYHLPPIILLPNGNESVNSRWLW